MIIINNNCAIFQKVALKRKDIDMLTSSSYEQDKRILYSLSRSLDEANCSCSSVSRRMGLLPINILLEYVALGLLELCRSKDARKQIEEVIVASKYNKKNLKE